MPKQTTTTTSLRPQLLAFLLAHLEARAPAALQWPATYPSGWATRVDGPAGTVLLPGRVAAAGNLLDDRPPLVAG